MTRSRIDSATTPGQPRAPRRRSRPRQHQQPGPAHVWLIRLRRGPQQAIVAVGLGKPSADYLAAQIRDVIDPPPLATSAHPVEEATAGHRGIT